MLSPRSLIARFPDLEVVVVGDALLDCWLSGPSDRLCREAPVPVVSVAERTYAPGGAGNTAANAAALGARVHLVSAIGDDPDGRVLRDELVRRGVLVESVPATGADGGQRRTPSKRRVLAGRQMLARLDDGESEPVPPPVAEALLERIERWTRRCDAIIVCDYGHGTLSDLVRERLVAMRHRWRFPVVVDAHDLGAWRALEPTAVTPNYDETLALLDGGGPQDGEDRAGYLERHGPRLLSGSGAGLVVATLDEAGALLLQGNRPPYRTYARPAAPGFTAGAGDSFVAAFALALAAGADEVSALELGNAAAGVVVQAPGTAVCRHPDLLRATAAETEEALVGAEELAAYVAAHRAAGRRLVFTNGCFDVLHRGHVSYLNQAKQLGDVLVVALNGDASVARLKGPDRPVNPAEDRAAVLSALSCVDHVVVFGTDSPTDLLELVRPDVYVKGGDYTPEMLPETPVVESLGGRVQILDYVEDRSTSQIIERIRSTATPNSSGGVR